MTEQCMGIIGASLQDRGKGDMIEKAGIFRGEPDYLFHKATVNVANAAEETGGKQNGE